MINIYDIDTTVHAAVLEHNATELFDDVDMEEIFKGDAREGAKLIAAYHTMAHAYGILRNNYDKSLREAKAKGHEEAIREIAEQGSGNAWNVERPSSLGNVVTGVKGPNTGQPMIGPHKQD